jgi:hypothetical protein
MNDKLNVAKTNAEKNLKNTGSFVVKNYKMILSVLFGLFILYWMMFILTPAMNMSVEEKAKIDSLNVLIMEMNKNQQILDDKIDGINEEIVEVDKGIDKIKGQKTIVKEIYHEKINSVSNFTEPELDSFFSDRYK